MKQIKSKINSVSNIQKMTKALEVVSIAKLQKVKHKTEQYREFLNEFFRIAKVVHEKVDLFAPTGTVQSDKTLLVVLSTDKGLCGSLNSKLFKTVFSAYADKKDDRANVDVFSVGKKALDFFVRTGFNNVGTLDVNDNFETEDLVAMYDFLLVAMKTNAYKSIKVCFNYFQNTIKQTPVILDLYPFSIQTVDSFVSQIGVDLQLNTYLEDTTEHADFTFEPSASLVREEFLNQFMQHLLYGAILQNKAGEFAARMMAMKNAKDNAGMIIDDLKLEFNKARQGAITQEISEIVSAKMAIESF